MINGVVELSSPLPHHLGMTTLSAKHLILADDDPRSRQELEKLAVENLQLIIYQTNEELLKRWLPIVSSALNAGKMGETLILGYLKYAQGKHDELRAQMFGGENRVQFWKFRNNAQNVFEIA